MKLFPFGCGVGLRFAKLKFCIEIAMTIVTIKNDDHDMKLRFFENSTQKKVKCGRQ